MQDDVIHFTEEELAQLLAPPPPANYFVYYDKKTGSILSVTNERNDKLEYFLEVEKSVAVPFLEGTLPLNDYCVAYDDKTGLTIIPKEDEFFIRRTNIFEIIKPLKSLDNTEFIVEWNQAVYGWNFYLTPKAKSRLMQEGLSQYIAVFISNADDLNFLYRTIYLDTSLLLAKDKIYQPFISDKEHDIKNLLVSSKLVFETYGLTTVYDNN
jgi:hypothetical protein